jgi:FkbM family methyltransferase
MCFKKIKKTTSDYIKDKISHTYSQEGEDLILKRIFNNKINGFYVDIGAYHPIKFSNTYLFYKKGWNGINIDAMPDSMKIFRKKRPRDINIEAAISEKQKNLTYYIFDEQAYNSLDEHIAQKRNKEGIHIKKEIKIPTIPLSKILEEYLSKNTEIDFLNIDVEGHDFEVLQSNNWKKYSPKIILIEIIGNTVEEIIKDPIYNYLKNKNYVFFSKLLNTCIFIQKNYYEQKYKQ